MRPDRSEAAGPTASSGATIPFPARTPMAKKPKAVVLGVGALGGIGGAASRRFAKEGYHVLVAGRTPQKIEAVVDAIRQDGGAATAFTVDGTKEEQVIRLFDAAMADDNDSGPADLFVFNMGNNAAVDF